MNVSVIFSPPEVDALHERDLSSTTCVVFDVLRATSTMLAAFANGADRIKPVTDIHEALREKERNPAVLLAGERNGIRIGSDLTGGVEFDLGNSPREMTRNVVEGRTLITTTTNGTRAIRACARARRVMIASFGNLATATDQLVALNPDEVLLVCSGTGEESCLEDTCGAGALVQRLESMDNAPSLADSAIIARHLYLHMWDDLLAGMSEAKNAKRLSGLHELALDIEYCLKIDQFDFAAALNQEGYLERRQ